MEINLLVLLFILLVAVCFGKYIYLVFKLRNKGDGIFASFFNPLYSEEPDILTSAGAIFSICVLLVISAGIFVYFCMVLSEISLYINLNK